MVWGTSLGNSLFKVTPGKVPVEKKNYKIEQLLITFSLALPASFLYYARTRLGSCASYLCSAVVNQDRERKYLHQKVGWLTKLMRLT